MVNTRPGSRQYALLDSKFSARDPSAIERVNAQYRAYLLRCARTRMADLPDDLHEEAVQELLAELWEFGAETFDRTRGSMRTYLAQRIRTSVRRVRAKYVAPGQRTRFNGNRPPCPPDSRDCGSLPWVVHGESGNALQSAECAEEIVVAETAPVEFEVDAELIMNRARAAPRVHDALRLVFWDDQSLASVSKMLAVPRTTLQSAINKFLAAERPTARVA